MEDLGKVFAGRPAAHFMEWTVIGRDGVSKRTIGPKREKQAHEIGSNPDGAFYIGERIQLAITPPFPGYLQLWNFGTSGKTKLLCDKQWVEDRLVSLRADVSGDTTAQSGRFEVVVAIVTKVPVEIGSEAMGAARPAVSTRGFQSVEEVEEVSLKDLPESDWAWSILETEVRQ